MLITTGINIIAVVEKQEGINHIVNKIKTLMTSTNSRLLNPEMLYFFLLEIALLFLNLTTYNNTHVEAIIAHMLKFMSIWVL